MKKLLFVGNPTILGENLGNVLKSNYNTDFISIRPKQIGNIRFSSYNALILDFTMLHKYSLTICKAAKNAVQTSLFYFYALLVFQNKSSWISMKPVLLTIYIFLFHHQHFYRKNWISYLPTIIWLQSMKTAT